MRMRRRKEKTLLEYRDNGEQGCVCMDILELKRHRLWVDYEELRERLSKAKASGKNYDRILNRIMKTGNKFRAIKEVIAEIQQAYKTVENMITIEINGVPFSRLSRESDYRRSCKGKVPYSERSVNRAAVEMAAKIGDPMEGYKCRHCQHWHVGHAVLW